MSGLPFALLSTLITYRAALALRKRWPSSPLTTPALTTMLGVAALLAATRSDVAAYERWKPVLTGLLGPATIALAVPLYRHRALIGGRVAAIAAGFLCGALTAMLTAVVTARALHLAHDLVAMLAIKSATVAISSSVARTIGVDPALTAILTVTTGIIGALIGPALLTALRVRDPLARGLAMGTVSHGIGTAQIALEHPVSAAAGGLAICLGAEFVAFTAPIVVPIIVR